SLLSYLLAQSSLPDWKEKSMPTAQLETSVPTGVWKSDPIHSRAGFSVKHMVVATYRGGFTEFDVTLANEDGDPRLYGSARVDSVDVRDETMNAHLLATDLFDD